MPRALVSTAVVLLALAGAATGAAQPAPVPDEAVWASSQQIVFTGYRGGIYLTSPAGGRPRLLVRTEDTMLSINGDGRLVYGTKGLHLFTIPLAGGKPRDLGFGLQGVWSPDGKQIAYKTLHAVMVEDADGRHKRVVAKDRYIDGTGAPTWSPDGRKLAYVACRAEFRSGVCKHESGFDVYVLGMTHAEEKQNGVTPRPAFDVYVVGLDGSDKHRVTPTPGFPQCPAWSGVGKLAFYATHFGTTPDLVAVVQKAGGLRPFRPGGCPVWAPSGRRFAVATTTGAYLMNFDGSDRKAITVAPHSRIVTSRIAWSPDGKWLTIADGSERSHLWVVRANGTGLKRLV